MNNTRINDDDNGNDANVEAIRKKIQDIKTRFSKEKMLDIVSDSENIPDSLESEYEPTDLDRLSYGNMDHHFQMFVRGFISAEDLMNGLEKLVIELDREFTELEEMFIWGKEVTL